MNWLPYFIGMLTLAFCLKDNVDFNRMQRYRNWLSKAVPTLKIPQTVESESVKTINMPLNLTIITDSTSDRCVLFNGPYCYPVDRNHSPKNASGCPGGGYAKACEHVRCSHDTPKRPLEEYGVPIEFVAYSGNESTTSANSSTCGLVLLDDELIFNGVADVDDQPYCNTLLPVIVLDTIDPNATYTLFFNVTPDSRVYEKKWATIFSVGGYSFSREKIIDVSFNVEERVINYATAHLEDHIYKNNDLEAEGFYTLLITGSEIVFLYNGETSAIFARSGVQQQPTAKLIVRLGGNGFLGSISNARLYNSTPSTSELYARFTSQSVANYVLEPQCKCPREYGDSFNLLKISDSRQISDNFCTGIFSHSTTPNTTRYSGSSQGKWAIFTQEGWMSDVTNQAEIRVQFNQPLLVYALSGAFPTFGSLVKRPKSMIVEVLAADDIQGVQVIVSNNCTGEYGIPQFELPNFSDFSTYMPSSYGRNKRSSNDASTRRCYHWSDIWFNSTKKDDSGNPKTYWMVIFIGPNNVPKFIADDLFGNVKVKLIGHEYGNESMKENWYSVSDLQVHARVHCGFSRFTAYGFPTDISSYYKFHSPRGKGFECYCNEGVTGDRCESCINTLRPRYMPSPGRCVDCDCSALAISLQCDKVTGQCDCEPGVNLTLAGRRCLWHVTDVHPLYGPIDGGTVVTIAGPYFNRSDISTYVRFQGEQVEIEPNLPRGEITFTTTQNGSDLMKVDLSVLPNGKNGLYIGTFYRIFLFEFRPNPVIESIKNPSTILSGGTNLTVTGSFFDSVMTPMFVVYILQNSSRTRTHAADCIVVASDIMHCPIPSLIAKYKINHMPARSYEVNSGLLNGIGGVEFSLGFLFDGHTRYRNMHRSSEISVRNMSTLYVWADPMVYEFEKDSGADILNYNPVSDGFITINGENLDSFFSADNYQVTIGLDSFCTVTSLTSTTLLCTPPLELPEVNQTNFKTQNGQVTPNVQVAVGPLTFHVGYLYYKTNFWIDNLSARYSLISCMVIIIIAIAIALAIMRRKYRQKKLTQLERMGLETLGDDYLNPVNSKLGDPSYFVKLSPNIQAYVNQCRVPIQNIQLGIQIGKGHFGMVYKARLLTLSGNNVTVAVKKLKDQLCSDLDELETFLTEATLMINLRHQNVLSLIGVALEEGASPLAIIPYMENGDLCTFIRCEDVNLLLADLLHFGLQIANGMAYLASERFVHRDLAARNCMIDDSYIVKIADFGMSRDVYEKDYYTMDNMNKPLPMKWMAVESLKEGRFTSMSDVWSFGITMWELLTRGNSPYPGMRNSDVKDFVCCGKRLDCPRFCPPRIWRLLLDCWKECPEERPTFSDMSTLISDVLKGEDDDSGDYPRSVTANISDDYVDRINDYDIEEYCRDKPVPAVRNHAPSNNYIN